MAKSISNNSSNELAILINLAKSQKSLSNNSSNELAIYPKLLSTCVARGYLRARTGVAIANFSVAAVLICGARNLQSDA
jgi:hypothetical protein